MNVPAALFRITPKRKQLEYPSADKQINVIYPHNTILFSHEKRNEVLKHATVWMNLENMLNENQEQATPQKKPVPKDHKFI